MNQRGLSLIELMVSLVIGLLLVSGAVTVYVQSGNTYRTSDAVARMQEVGRYALDIIEPDVRLAGFYGMTNRADAVTNSVSDATITPNCGTNWIGSAALSLDGRNGGTALSSATSCTTPNRVTGSDIVIVRRAGSATAALDNTKIQVHSTRLAATIFRAGNPASVPSGMPVAPQAETRDLVVNAYFVAASGDNFSLHRRTLVGTNFRDDEVIPGIQDLQVQFGIDQNNDGTAEQYVNPGSVGTARIVSARLWIMVVADNRDNALNDTAVYAYADRAYAAAFTDKRRRIVMTKTIQIRNARP